MKRRYSLDAPLSADQANFEQSDTNLVETSLREVFRRFRKVFRRFRACSDLFSRIRIRSDTFGCFRQ